MYSIDFGNLHFAQAGIEHCLDLFLFPVQKPLARAFGSAKLHAFGFLPGEGFFGALADEPALNLGRDAEGESQDFAGNVVAQAVVVLDRPYLGSDFHAAVEDRHDHEKGTAQPADFRTDDDVAFPHSFQEFAQPAFVYLLGAAAGFADPSVYLQGVVFAEAFDFNTLVLYRLAVGAYANISINHIPIVFSVCFIQYIPMVMLVGKAINEYLCGT